MASLEKTAQEVGQLAPRVMAGVRGGFMPEESVTTGQMITVLALAEMGRAKITSISRRMGVSPPTTTGIIDRLQRAGYVRRERDVQDRRVVFVILTKRGASFVEKVKAAIQERWMKIMVYLSDQEREEYVKLLRKIVDGLAREAQRENPDEKP